MDATEEKFYEMVALEIACKEMRPGVFAKAFADAAGDEKLAKTFYIKYRVAQLRDEYFKELAAAQEAEKLKGQFVFDEVLSCKCGKPIVNRHCPICGTKRKV
jgi:rubrerythrin